MDRLLNARDVDTLEKIFATGTCGGDPSAHALMIAKARALLADNALWKVQVASAAAVCDRKENELADAKLEVERLRAEQDEIHAILGRYEWDSVSLAGGVAALAEAWKGDDLLGQLEAARGDLRVERERSEMLEKKLADQQSNNWARPVKPFAVTTTSTAVNPAKPGLQPLKCPCGGRIEFGRVRVGHCMNCGASCRVMDPPPDTCDSQLTAALVEANRNTAKWRKRALQWREAALHERARLLNLRGELISAPEPLPEGWEDNEL